MIRPSLMLSVLSLILLLFIAAHAQQSSDGANSNSLLESRKFELEQQKVRIEEEKLRLQRIRKWLTGASIIIPLLIGIYTSRAQSRSNFELKAAEIVLNTKTPYGTLSKAKALKKIFPKRLSSNFADSFEPKEYLAPSVEAKIEILKVIAEHIEHKQEVIKMWK